MGRNKHLRKLIAGQLDSVARHQEKIKKELEKSSPDLGRLQHWQKEIDHAWTKVRKWEERLRR